MLMGVSCFVTGASSVSALVCGNVGFSQFLLYNLHRPFQSRWLLCLLEIYNFWLINCTASPPWVL